MNETIIYARVSSKEQEREGYSIEAQLKLLRKYAKEKGFKVVREYTEAESAKTTGRAQFNSMLKHLKANPNIKNLLCEKTDRVSRNFKDIAILDAIMNEQKLTIHLVKENVLLHSDSKSHEKFIFGIKAVMAKNYSDNLSEEVKKGMREKAKQGNYPGGNIPYGYLIDKNNGRIFPDPQRSHHIKQMFELYAENKMSLRSLASWARSQGLTTPRSGKPITLCQIDRILKNPFYYGVFQWAREIFKGNHEPIISKQLYDKTQRAFKLSSKPQINRKQFALSSLMTCSRCGCKITAERKKGKYTYYHCTGMKTGGCDLVYVREENIIDQFSNLIAPVVISDKNANRVLSELEKRQNVDSSKIKSDKLRFQMSLGQIEKWSQQAYIDKLEGTIGNEQWMMYNQKWEAESAQIRHQLNSLDGDFSRILPAAERILELSQKLPSLWVEQNNYEKRKLIDLVYSNSCLDGVSLSATYKKPFSFIAEGNQNKKWRG